MKVLIDTNVALDAILMRMPHYENSRKVIGLSESKNIQCFISAAAVTDIFYIANKALKNKRTTLERLKALLDAVSIVAVTGNTIKAAIDLDWDDFEDAVQYSSAEELFADCIVTRNPKDFQESQIMVLPPNEFVDNFLT
ncbi:MAG: PIN domain-containing protein [Defluviitaleaceae bacterium]|nr:PIN domain-containing protein [Defluviitaleaceae bacterium]